VFPLISLGGLVTSWRAGMVDPKGLRVPWHVFIVSWTEMTPAERFANGIEHGHRFLGWLVGVMAIVLAIAMWRAVAGRSRWLGVAVLTGVSIQGILGMLRVNLQSAGWGLEFAMFHGFFGQLVFCLAVSTALATSCTWLAEPKLEIEGAQRLRRLCTLTVGLMLAQLLAGVWLRQQGQGNWGEALFLHVVLALAVIAHVVLLFARIFRQTNVTESIFRQPAALMVALVVAQAGLGIAAWLAGGGLGALHYQPSDTLLATFATAHVGIGALLLATAIVLTLRTHHHLVVHAKPAFVPLRTVEGTA
jgi:cytochrome c oxidase assembly protein subunit 15